MSRTKTTMDRVLCIILSLIVIVGMVPVTVFAATAGSLSTDIDQKVFNVGKATEFTFTSTANDDAGTMVVGSFDFSDPSAIEKLEYLESKDGNWYEFNGDFGPATGFPMSDATSRFRATFKKAGDYSVTVSVKNVDSGDVLCSITEDVKAINNFSTLTTDIGEKEYIVGQATEFTFTSTANEDAGIMVVGSFDFSDPSAIEKLEYLESKDGNWYEFNGDFGPSTGFPMSDATSKFRVTFKKSGNYSVTAVMKRVDTGEVLCSSGTVTLTAIAEYDVNVTTNEGGTVKIDGKNTSVITVIENKNVPISVEADKGYQIASVSINGIDQKLDSKTSFDCNVTITENTSITVSFVKVYEITVSHTGEGTVATTPECDGGIVIVNSGTEVEIVATPKTNYRVSEATVNGETDNSIKGVNNEEYEYKFTADKDYTVVITFAPNRYNVTAANTENGTVNIESNVVDHNGSTKVSLVPDAGYTVGSVMVNGVDTEVVTPDDTTAYFMIEGIVEDKEVAVTFKKTATAEMSNVAFNTDDALRANLDGTLYVFAKDNTVTFHTTKNGIRIYDTNDKLVGGAWNKNSVGISKTTSIGKISLYYKAEGEWVPAWHDVTVVSKNNPLNIVVDVNETETTITPATPNAHEYYNSDVSVAISTEDKGSYSGIASVEYWIMNGNEETEREIPYTYEVGGTIMNKYNANIIVDATTNNSDNVVVNVKVTDRAGNTETKTVALKINSTKPSVSVSIDGILHTEATEGKYNTSRTATVTYIDRATTFDETAAMDGIVISAKDASGKDVAISKVAMIKWDHSGDTHTATISFNADANYEWSVSYKNYADLSDDEIVATGDSVYSFAVDTTAPSAKIELDKTTWDDIVSTLTFGLFKNYSVTAVATGSDATTDIYDIVYYKSNEAAALKEGQLDVLFEEGKFTKETITVSADERFVVYARITDLAGNTKYISTDGVIYDKTESVITITPPEANENGYYNKDIVVPISVNDAVNADTAYSGIKAINYIVEKDGRKTQEGNLYTYDVENSTYDQLKADWSGNITVESKKNNSDNIKVTVKVVDNAGNEYEKSVVLAINIDQPTSAIDFSDKANKVVDGYGYYGGARTATITIIDRASSFDAEAATNGITFSAVNAKGDTVKLSGDDVVISGWTSSGNKHTATVTFNKDGKYTWSFAYTNKAGNEMKDIATESSKSPYAFAVDTTEPTGAVTVNTNTWDKLLSVLTFGLYNNVKADVTATADDEISPFIIEYFETDNPIAMTEDELKKETFKAYKDYSVENDKQFVVYLKITDYAGNYTYINSDGYIVDKVPSTITLTPSAANGFYDADANINGQYGLYNKDSNISVDVVVKDAKPYSGIKSVEYWVENNNVKTQEGELFTFENATPSQDDLVNEWTGTINVDKTLNNSCNVVVYVKTVDNAGNKNIDSKKLDIDITVPVIDIKYDNNKDNNGNTYFNNQRTATIVITERNHHFDSEAATNGIVVTAVDAKGNTVENAYTLSSWTTVANDVNPDAATHTATIFFEKDANYTWSINYTDKAGNANDGVNLADGTVAAFDFTVDTTDPFGTVKATSSEGRETEWNELKNALTFGFWSKEKITITGTSDDLTSAPIAAVEYYKVKATSARDGTTALTAKELDEITTWTKFDGLEISSDEQFTVYLKITDLAGNYTYISTNGLIVDRNAPMEEAIAPEITVEPQQPINGLYNGDVKVAIKVVDPLIGGTYSGLRTVTYKVLNMGVETQTGTLYAFENTDPKQSDLLQTWTGEITVDSTLNNSNDVVIVVYAEDNSLNNSDDKVAIKIDITDPTIDVTYDNNSADNAKYFKDNRTATIVVTERNFNADDVKVTITNTDGVIPTIGEWKKTEGTGNLDDTKWITTVTYNADGDYTFDIAYIDLAENACAGAQYGNSVAPTEFTVDKTLPVVSVSYDNNNAKNDKYFASSRTATVVINEHNFDVNRVVFTQTAALNGTNFAVPAASWVNNGDSHTATIAYTADGDYTFDVAVTDMAANESEAANYGNSVAGKDFVVDQNIEKPTIGGIINGGAYKESVVPTISFNDVNYDTYEVKLVRTRMGEKNVDVTDKFIKAIDEQAQGGAGSYDTFEKIVENDGIYILTVKMIDKAGNEDTEEYTFTVNRFGSVYVYSDYLASLIKDGGQYITSIDGDLVITEYNADRILDGSLKILLTRDGEAIDVDFTSNPSDINAQVSIGESGWYQYVYTIKSSNFEKDGVYKISLISSYATTDSEKNDSTSVPDNSVDAAGNKIVDAINFTVDATPPEIRNIIGLDKAIVNAQDLTVKYTVVDVGGLKSVEIFVDNKPLDTITTFDNLNSYTGEFVLGENNNAQTVRIKVTDLAGNVTDTESIDDEDVPLGEFAFNKTVTVSTNLFVRWYANKLLFWGSIGGVVVLAGAICFIVAFKRKKKEEK